MYPTHQLALSMESYLLHILLGQKILKGFHKPSIVKGQCMIEGHSIAPIHTCINMYLLTSSLI